MSVFSVPVLETLGWLVLHEREVRFLLFNSKAPVKNFPLSCNIALPCLLLLLLLLRLHGQLFELVTIHLHVRADDLVCDGCNCLVPVLLLGAIKQALHDDWIRFLDVVLHELLDHLRVEQKECALSRLVVHPLAS